MFCNENDIIYGQNSKTKILISDDFRRYFRDLMISHERHKKYVKRLGYDLGNNNITFKNLNQKYLSLVLLWYAMDYSLFIVA